METDEYLLTAMSDPVASQQRTARLWHDAVTTPSKLPGWTSKRCWRVGPLSDLFFGDHRHNFPNGSGIGKDLPSRDSR
jgi:hypothetical protein